MERHLEGQSLPAVAEAMGISYYTARKWWRVYRQEGWSGLLPKPFGPPVTGLLGHFDSLVKYVALRLKLEHPKWGPTTTLFYMRRRPSLRGLRLPKETALWEYWHRFRERLIQPQRPATKRPDPAPETEVVEVHQRWQIDFKGEVETSVGWVSPFQVRDVVGRATLGSFVHLLGIKRKESSVSVRQVQKDLRQTFSRWGLPDEIQMDRDPVFQGFHVDISQGGTFSVVIRVDDNLVQYLQVAKEGNTLKIGLKPGYSVRNATLQAEVTMPELTGLDLSGGSHATITDFKSTKALDVDLSGGSHLRGDIEAGNASFDLSGGSDVTLSGLGQNVTIDASGSSEVDLADFPVADVNVEVSGGSEATVKPSGRLDADASGGSDVYYLGNPTLGKIGTSGSSSVERK